MTFQMQYHTSKQGYVFSNVVNLNTLPALNLF